MQFTLEEVSSGFPEALCARVPNGRVKNYSTQNHTIYYTEESGNHVKKQSERFSATSSLPDV